MSGKQTLALAVAMLHHSLMKKDSPPPLSAVCSPKHKLHLHSLLRFYFESTPEAKSLEKWSFVIKCID